MQLTKNAVTVSAYEVCKYDLYSVLQADVDNNQQSSIQPVTSLLVTSQGMRSIFTRSVAIYIPRYSRFSLSLEC